MYNPSLTVRKVAKFFPERFNRIPLDSVSKIAYAFSVVIVAAQKLQDVLPGFFQSIQDRPRRWIRFARHIVPANRDQSASGRPRAWSVRGVACKLSSSATSSSSTIRK